MRKYNIIVEYITDLHSNLHDCHSSCIEYEFVLDHMSEFDAESESEFDIDHMLHLLFSDFFLPFISFSVFVSPFNRGLLLV